TQLLAARVMRIAQMHRHWEGWLFFNCLESRRNTVIRGPGLGRARDMKSGMSKDYTRLGIADHLYRLGGGDGRLEGAVIGKSHILRRLNHDPARDKAGILTGVNEPCEPIENRVRRRRASQRLDKRGYY